MNVEIIQKDQPEKFQAFNNAFENRSPIRWDGYIGQKITQVSIRRSGEYFIGVFEIEENN